MKKTLSFVIPVYNAEDYIDECINSILSQINEECEIFLVDDASPDACPEICDSYAQKYDSIKVLHKQNEGPGVARNEGIQNASGDYIMFVDSDDVISQGSVEKILCTIKEGKFDICFLDAEKFFPDGQAQNLGDCVEKSMVTGKGADEVCEYLATRPKFMGSPCTKVFRKDFLLENKLFFPTENKNAEDLWFVRDCIYMAESFCAIDDIVYRYRQAVGNSRSSNMVRSCEGLLAFVKDCADKHTKDRVAINKKSLDIMSFAAYEYAILLFCFSKITDKEYKKAFLKRMKEYKWVTKFAKNKKIAIVCLAIRVAGIRVLSTLFGIVKK